MGEVVLRAEHMVKEFGPTKAVTDVTLELKSGVVTGLVGENGSGKSTISSMIAGVYPPTSGTMTFKGQPHKPKSVLEARRAGIQYLTQEQGTIDGMTVAENMFLGEEDSMSSHHIVDIKKLTAKAREALDNIGLDDIVADRNISEYAFETRKMIETARALAVQPAVFIIDETTTALSQKGLNRMYELIARYKEAGTAILIISHDLDEVKRLCDEVVVMRDGQYIDTLTGSDIEPAYMRQRMIGRELTGSYYREDRECSYEDEVVMSAENLTVDGLFKDISFELHKGEILGIGGLSDCGMHELLKTAFGAIEPSSGKITLVQENVSPKNTTVSVKHKVAYMPKDRDKESLFQATSIKDNIMATCLDKIKKGFLISPGAEKKLANKEASEMEVKMNNIEQMVKDLSGGNKQKVVIAKWLANDSKIFIMDCPTRGIDVGVKAKIYKLMEEMKNEGMSILMVSEEMVELIGMADRIITIKDGKMSQEFKRSPELTEATLISAIV